MPVQNSSIICESKEEICKLKYRPEENINSVNDDQSINSICHLFISSVSTLSCI